MSDGSAFQARGPAMENALSVTRSRVRETTKLPRTLDRSRVSSQRRTSSDRYCGAVPWLMSNIKVHCSILAASGAASGEVVHGMVAWCADDAIARSKQTQSPSQQTAITWRYRQLQRVPVCRDDVISLVIDVIIISDVSLHNEHVSESARTVIDWKS